MSPTTTTTTTNDSSNTAVEDQLISLSLKHDPILSQFINVLTQLKSDGVSEYEPRFESIVQLAQLYIANKISISGKSVVSNGTLSNGNGESSMDMSDDKEVAGEGEEEDRLKPSQYGLFRAQVDAYKHLSRNLPIPLTTLTKISNALYDPQKDNVLDTLKYYSKGTIKVENATPPNPDIPEVTNKGLYEALQAIQEREQRIDSKIHYRLEELKELPSNIQPELKNRSLIEMKQLKVLGVQKKVRNDVLHEVNDDIYLNSVQEIDMFVKPIPRVISKPSEIMYDASNTQQIPDSIFVTQRKKLLSAILNHQKEFKEFHNRKDKTVKNTLKMIKKYHVEKEKREQELLRRKRIELLKNQDTAGYRDLLAKTKNERLEMLMSQTDSLLSKIDFLVQKEKDEQERRAEKEREEREAKEKSAADKEKEEKEKQEKEKQEKEQDKMDVGSNATNGSNGATTTTPSTVLHKRSSIYNEEIITEQPECMIGGKLKEYQITGLQWLVNLYNNKLNGILADEMGLGKTVQTIALICYLYEKKRLGEPILVVAPLSTISNWETEFQRWAPKIPVLVFRGDPEERRILARRIPHKEFGVLITSFQYILSEKTRLGRVPWCYIIVDEGHRIKNKSSKLSIQLRQYHSKYRLLLTGTPLQNDLGELWSLLNFLLPSVFNSLDTFEQWFNAPFASSTSSNKKANNKLIEVNEEEQLIIINRLHQVLRYFLLRRLKKDVESQLPEKKERIIKCNLSAMQIVMYRCIVEHGVLPMDPSSEMYSKSKSKMRGFNNIVKQLQKVCNHPYLFMNEWDINEDLVRAAGKFDMMDQILIKMRASGHRTLIFTQMTEVMNMMAEYFSLREWDYLRLDGSTKPDERGRLVIEWNRKDSPYSIFILSTHAGGLGMNLQTADTVIIFDSDWNPQMDLQAQDRCHRVGQVNRVSVFRLISANSIEEKILERATDKLEIDAKIIQAGMFNTHSNDIERRAKLEEFLHGFPSSTTEEPITDLEEINRLIARDDEELAQFNQLDKDMAKSKAAALRSSSSSIGSNKSPAKEGLNTSIGGMTAAHSRLITESELPEWLLRSPVEEVEVLTQRKRAEIVNDDLTEIQYMRMVDKGMSVKEYKDYLENKRKLKNASSNRKEKKKVAKKKKNNKKRKDDDEEEEDEEDSEEDSLITSSEDEGFDIDAMSNGEEEEDSEEGKSNEPKKRVRRTAAAILAASPGYPKPGTRNTPKRGRDDDSGTESIKSPTSDNENGRNKQLKSESGSVKRRGRPPKATNTTTEVVQEEEEDNNDVNMNNNNNNNSNNENDKPKRKLTFTFGGKPIGSPTGTNNNINGSSSEDAEEQADGPTGTPYKPRRSSTSQPNSSSKKANGEMNGTNGNGNGHEMSADSIYGNIWEKIKEFKERGRKLSKMFWEQPSREDYPEYFEVIKNPISMQEIKNNKYKSVEHYITDWRLMFDNALEFNDPSSQLYKDAINLYDLFTQEIKANFEGVNVPSLSKL